jgi:regulator of sigma E protease
MISSFAFTLVTFLILLTILVFVHEWGHYYVARRCGVRVEIFSIGFGREIYGWSDRHGTRWKIGAIPLGGYVKFFGDANVASMTSETLDAMSEEDRAQAFPLKPLRQRAAIVAAGPVVNLIFAAFLFAGIYMTAGQPIVTSEITEVTAGSAAEAAGIETGDVVLSVNQHPIRTFQEMGEFIVASGGNPLQLVIGRGEQQVNLVVTPRMVDFEGNPSDRPFLGVRGGVVEHVKLGPAWALIEGTVTTGRIMGLIMVTAGELLTGSRSADELGGPIRIAQVSGEAASLGLVSFVWFMALISVNLGLVNLFPIPLLDGGHLMFYGFEAVRGRPVSPRMQEIGYMIGITIVIGLLLMVTWNDLSSLEIWQNLGQ